MAFSGGRGSGRTKLGVQTPPVLMSHVEHLNVDNDLNIPLYQLDPEPSFSLHTNRCHVVRVGVERAPSFVKIHATSDLYVTLTSAQPFEPTALSPLYITQSSALTLQKHSF